MMAWRVDSYACVWAACALVLGCGGGAAGEGGTGEVDGGQDVAGADASGQDGAVDDAGVDAAADSDGDAASGGAGDAAGDAASGDSDVGGQDAATPAACASAADCKQPSATCRAAICDPALGCLEVALPDAAICDDGDACTVASVCAAGVCVGALPLDCDDDNPCTKDGCEAATGCVALPISASPCDDGDVCTVGDACVAGSCVAGVATCACKKHADCAAFEDGDVCNGTLYCEPTSHSCKVNPASVVLCASDDAACTVTSCDKQKGVCVKGAAPLATPCDDGVACTTGDHCKDGACVAGTKTCCSADADCVDDGDLCNGTLFCNLAKGLCELNPLTVVTCQTAGDGPCVKTGCVAAKGACVAQPVKDGNPCDDGETCTDGDHCSGGVCAAGTNTCACKVDGDCAAQEDGNLCNGTLYCDASVGACKLNPATVVKCTGQGDTACAAAACVPKTGKCVVGPKADGTPCDADGDGCTPNDACKAGSCVADTNVCPCKADADCADKNDADACNGVLYCDKLVHTCKVNPATVVFCPDPVGPNAACLANLCNPVNGLCVTLPSQEGGACDADGNPCTPVDVCSKGACVADANVCACQLDADCAAKEDGDPCNGTLRCDKISHQCVVNPATVIKCSDIFDTACTQNRCQPESGTCAPTAVRELLHCDADGNACTLYDVCKAGQCVPGQNVCDCGVDVDCKPFDDKDACNGALFCGGSAGDKRCVVNKATVVSCPAGDPDGCMTSACDKATGACKPTPWPEGKPCVHGDPCKQATVCAQGSCGGGVPKACDDNNPCTTDACEPGKGCVATAFALDLAAAVTCIDGDACTGAEVCDKGACKGSKVDCGDGNPCTQDGCDAKTGCVYAPLAAACDDGNPCTASDTCVAGVCKGAGAANCDDANACTLDSCDAESGCSSAKAAACDDGIACTKQDSCVGGVCKGKVDCDDANACTADGCDAKTGTCAHAPIGGDCDDGDACTTGDACSGGACKLLAVKVCDDGNVCTDDSCDAKKGCVGLANAAPCSLGGCTTGDQCAAKACKAGGSDRVFAKVMVTAGVGELVVDVRPIGAGDLIVTGARSYPGQYGPSTAAAVARLGPDGAAKWWTNLPGGSGSSAARSVVRADGTVATLYRPTGCAALAILAADGKLLSTAPMVAHNCGPSGSGNGGQTPVALREHVVGGGGVLHAFTTINLYGNGEVVLRLAPDHSTAQAFVRYVDGRDNSIGDGVVLADGSVAYAGWSNEPAGALGGLDAVLTLLDAKLVQTARLHYGGGGHDLFTSLAPGADGGFVLGGRSASGGSGDDSFIQRVDAKGALQWSTPLGVAHFDQLAQLLVDPAGVVLYVALHEEAPGGTWNSRYGALSASGVALWQRADGVAGRKDDLTALARLPSGDLYLVGRDMPNPNDPVFNDVKLLRADASGFTSCAAAGKCAAVSLVGCSDGDVCTADYCDADAGCKAVAHAGVCDDGDACTALDLCDQAGKCKPGAEVLCDDGELCTTETCDSQQGCVVKAVPDGTSCGSGVVCVKGACQ